MATIHHTGQPGPDQASFRGVMSFEILPGCKHTDARSNERLGANETTIQHLFKQWEALFHRINEDALSEVESKRLTAQMVVVEHAMFALQAETAADFICQMTAFTDCGGNFADDRSGTGHRMVAAAAHLLARAA